MLKRAATCGGNVVKVRGICVLIPPAEDISLFYVRVLLYFTFTLLLLFTVYVYLTLLFFLQSISLSKHSDPLFRSKRFNLPSVLVKVPSFHMDPSPGLCFQDTTRYPRRGRQLGMTGMS